MDDIAAAAKPFKFKHLRDIFAGGVSSPHKLALAITLGTFFGLFPFFFIPTIFIILAAVRLKLNLGVMMVANYLFWPLQIILFVPYIHLGDRLFGGHAQATSFTAMAHAFSSGFIAAFRSLFSALTLATGAWAVSSIPAGLLVYAILRFVAGFMYRAAVK